MKFMLLLSSLLLLDDSTALQPLSSRRQFFTSSAAAVGAAAATTLFPAPSSAVAPLTDSELKKVERALAPNPPSNTLVRPKIDLNFAVWLTRASYSEADQLDVVPVDQLERDMYQLRTSAYQPYLKRVGTLSQGDLTDPKYFDYISAVQYVMINRAIQNPEVSFDELRQMDDDGNKFEMVHVERELPNSQLVSAYEERVGNSILGYIHDKYDDTILALPSLSPRPDLSEVSASLQKLVNIFLINGFAMKGYVEQTKPKSFCFTLQSPATLWSGQVLAKQGFPVRNDFLLNTAKRHIESMGYKVKSSSVQIKNDQEVSYLVIE